MLALKISFDHLWLMIYDQIFDMNEKGILNKKFPIIIIVMF